MPDLSKERPASVFVGSGRRHMRRIALGDRRFSPAGARCGFLCRSLALPALALSAGLAACVLLPAGARAQTATQDINISATVNSACTINNASAGTVDTAIIPISAAGNVVTTPITPNNAPYANVACNGPSDLQLTSLSGGVVNASTASGFANIINYTASATWNSVTATVNTSTVPGATGPEAGAVAPVATAFAGSLSVTITPIANTLPLVQGAYSDTLRVTLTPQ